MHIASRSAWEHARLEGAYAPPSLLRDGFIHFSRPDQLLLPANALYRGEPDLVLLCVDARRLKSELRWERPRPLSDDRFPHLHGPLNLDSVVDVVEFGLGEDGRFHLPARVLELEERLGAS